MAILLKRPLAELDLLDIWDYTEHGHKLRILKIRDNIIKIEKLVKRVRND